MRLGLLVPTRSAHSSQTVVVVSLNPTAVPNNIRICWKKLMPQLYDSSYLQPAATGSNPNHTIHAFNDLHSKLFAIVLALFWEKDENKSKRAGVGLNFLKIFSLCRRSNDPISISGILKICLLPSAVPLSRAHPSHCLLPV